MGFPTNHHHALIELRASPLTIPKWGSDTQIWRFSHKFRQKALKVCYKVSSSKNFQRQSRSAINYLSNGTNILAGVDLVLVKLEPKGTTQIGRMRVSRFTRVALCNRRCRPSCCDSSIFVGNKML